VSMDLSQPVAREDVAHAGACTLRLEAVFRDIGEQHVQAVAAAMIERAHELANLPQCECDVDVSVQWGSPGGTGPDEPGCAPVSGRSSAR
jgi:hypothetical protein